MKVIIPPPLKTGDSIGLITPSDYLSDGYEKSIEILQSWGLKVKFGKHIHEKVSDFMAGSAEQRQEDLLQMIMDPEIKAVWAMNGGYAAMDILPVLTIKTIEHLKSDPKWFLGYSDISIILNVLTSINISNIHSLNCWSLSEWDKFSQEKIRKILYGQRPQTEIYINNVESLISGKAQGRMLASNLDILVHLLGTKYDPLENGNEEVILAFEETSRPMEDIQRYVDQILNHRKVNRICGIILGRFVNAQSADYPKWSQGQSVEKMIMSRVRMFHPVPLLSWPEFGHSNRDSNKNWKMKLFGNKGNPETFIPFVNLENVRIVSNENSKIELLGVS